MRHRVYGRYGFVVVAVLLCLSLVLNLYLLLERGQGDVEGYPLLAPVFDDMGREEFLESQAYYVSNYRDVQEALRSGIALNSNERYSVYFESLNSGAWFGIDEHERYVPASLPKVPTMAAILKMVERGELRLDEEVMILPSDIDERFGMLGYLEPGMSMSVQELIEQMAVYSDNTAYQALARVAGAERLQEAITGLGYPYLALKYYDVNNNTMSPAEYANIFRALYYSTYLKRSSSQMLLEMLSKAVYTQGIRSGVPQQYVVAHKMGEYGSQQSYHDCGIVYLPDNPYILCIMTKGLSQQRANFVMAETSRIVYEGVSS